MVTQSDRVSQLETELENQFASWLKFFAKVE